MSDGQTIRLIWGVAALVLAVSALVAHRLSLSLIVKSALGWAAVAAVIYVAVQHRYEIQAAATTVSGALGLDDQQIDGKTVRIRMGTDGHFRARVKLNGVERLMLIDTGATMTTISRETAAAAGITPERHSAIVDTGNGNAVDHPATVAKLELGSLAAQDFTVFVADDDTESVGMNFLSRLKSWRVEGNTLVLEPK